MGCNNLAVKAFLNVEIEVHDIDLHFANLMLHSCKGNWRAVETAKSEAETLLSKVRSLKNLGQQIISTSSEEIQDAKANLIPLIREMDNYCRNPPEKIQQLLNETPQLIETNSEYFKKILFLKSQYDNLVKEHSRWVEPYFSIFIESSSNEEASKKAKELSNTTKKGFNNAESLCKVENITIATLEDPDFSMHVFTLIKFLEPFVGLTLSLTEIECALIKIKISDANEILKLVKEKYQNQEVKRELEATKQQVALSGKWISRTFFPELTSRNANCSGEESKQEKISSSIKQP
jgi:hypothetical protein